MRRSNPFKTMKYELVATTLALPTIIASATCGLNGSPVTDVTGTGFNASWTGGSIAETTYAWYSGSEIDLYGFREYRLCGTTQSTKSNEYYTTNTAMDQSYAWNVNVFKWAKSQVQGDNGWCYSYAF